MTNAFFRLIRFSGLPWLVRKCVQRNKVTLLMFHDIEPEKAKEAFSWLKKNYSIIGLQDYLAAVKEGKKLPAMSVIITFDDGHCGNFKLLPVIQELKVPVTIFLCSDIVGTRRHYWFRHSKDVQEEREKLKKMPNDQRLEELLPHGFEQTKEYDDTQALSREQIEKMKDWVDFQSHTCFHPCLTQCDDKTAWDEISLSKKHLEKDYSLRINSIAYPNGDYSERDIRLAKEAGYSCGVTVDFGYNDLHSDLFRLKRISVNDARTMDELIVKSSGCYAWLKRMIK